MVGSSWFKTFFSSRCIRNRAQAPSEALSKLQSEGETSPLLGGQGDGASGDDPLPARQLGKYRGGTAESFLTFMLMCLHGFTDQPFLPACSRTRRTRRWRPTCSWIWYDLCNIRLHHPTPHHCSDSQRWPPQPPLSLLPSLLHRCSALKWTCHFLSPKNQLGASSTAFSDSSAHVRPLLLLIRNSGCFECLRQCYVSGGSAWVRFKWWDKRGTLCKGQACQGFTASLLHHACY